MTYTTSIFHEGFEYEVEAECHDDSDDTGAKWTEVELLKVDPELLAVMTEETIRHHVATSWQNFQDIDHE